VDGDALLRRWLAQQRELGDQELILSSLTARQAAAAMRGIPTSLAASARTATPDAPRSPEAAPLAVRALSADFSAPDPAGSAPPDWRAELSAAGAAPGKGAGGERAPLPDAVTRRRVPDRGAPLAPTPDVANAASIAEVAELIAQCRGCPLFRTALNPVPGEGNPQADFVCVGEAPGATEDEQGRPFVGAAGQLLTKILAAVNLEREDVFIMNVLKHRPPGNRNPDPSEVAACRPFLLRQLELIQPKVILALGTFAAQTLLETKDSLGKLRGRVHSFQGIPVVVTYHPAALLRNPAWKRPTWEDVQFARRILDVGPGA
jgi:uracil-DNA glycosylase